MGLHRKILELGLLVLSLHSCSRDAAKNQRAGAAAQGVAAQGGGAQGVAAQGGGAQPGTSGAAGAGAAIGAGASARPSPTRLDPKRIHSKTIGKEADAICAVAYGPDGKHLLTGSEDGSAKLWTVFSGERPGEGEKPELLHKDKEEACAVAFDSRDRWFATGSWAHSVHVHDAPSRREIATLDGGRVKSLVFSNSGTLWAVNLEGDIRVWSPPDSKVVKKRKITNKGLTSVAVSAAEDLAAAAGYDGTLYLLDPKTLSEVRRCEAGGREIFSVVFSLNGREIVSAEGSADQTQNEVVIRNAQTCAPLRRLTGHKEFIYSVALSPDGAVLASAGLDATIRLYQYDGSLITQLTAHREAVHGVAFRLDGQQLASVAGRGRIGGVSGTDNTVRIWTWGP